MPPAGFIVNPQNIHLTTSQNRCRFPAMNLANLAPAFTPETARDCQRRAVESRMARIEREKAEDRQRDIEARAIALAMIPDAEEKRVSRTKKQIDRLLEDMESADSFDERKEIAAAIERLWKLVQPTAGVQRNRAKARPEAPRPTQASDSQAETPTH